MADDLTARIVDLVAKALAERDGACPAAPRPSGTARRRLRPSSPPAGS